MTFSSTLLHVLLVSSVCHTLHASSTAAYECNYVVYSGKYFATDKCYVDPSTQLNFMWMCDFKELFQFSNSNPTCNMDGKVLVPTLNASWFCNGAYGNCGWNQINNCDQPIEKQAQHARPFGVCEGDTKDGASAIYQCCPDKKTVVYQSFIGTSTCNASAASKIDRVYHNESCHLDLNIHRKASDVVCGGSNNVVACPGIKTHHPTQSPSRSATVTTSTSTTRPTAGPSISPTPFPTNQTRSSTTVPNPPVPSHKQASMSIGVLIFIIVAVVLMCFCWGFYCRLAKHARPRGWEDSEDWWNDDEYGGMPLAANVPLRANDPVNYAGTSGTAEDPERATSANRPPVDHQSGSDTQSSGLFCF